MKKHLTLLLIFSIITAPATIFADSTEQPMIDNKIIEIEESVDSNELQIENITIKEEIENEIKEDDGVVINLNKAIEAVEKAEITLLIEDYNVAKNLVRNLLESEEKTSLKERLEAVYQTIHTDAIPLDKNEVEAEEKTEESNLQEELEKVQEDTSLSEEIKNGDNTDDLSDSQDIGRIEEKNDMLPKPNLNDTLNQSIENIITRMDDIHVNINSQELRNLKNKIKDLPSGAEKSKLMIKINSIEIMNRKQEFRSSLEGIQ